MAGLVGRGAQGRAQGRAQQPVGHAARGLLVAVAEQQVCGFVREHPRELVIAADRAHQAHVDTNRVLARVRVRVHAVVEDELKLHLPDERAAVRIAPERLQAGLDDGGPESTEHTVEFVFHRVDWRVARLGQLVAGKLCAGTLDVRRGDLGWNQNGSGGAAGERNNGENDRQTDRRHDALPGHSRPNTRPSASTTRIASLGGATYTDRGRGDGLPIVAFRGGRLLQQPSAPPFPARARNGAGPLQSSLR